MPAPHHNPPVLQQALVFLLEEQLERKEAERSLDRVRGAKNAGRVRQATQRTLSEGYYLWAEYLFWLAEAMRAGAAFQLEARELDGVKLVQSARLQFEREHPACRKCGSPNKEFALLCWNCNARLNEAAA